MFDVTFIVNPETQERIGGKVLSYQGHARSCALLTLVTKFRNGNQRGAVGDGSAACVAAASLHVARGVIVPGAALTTFSGPLVTADGSAP